MNVTPISNELAAATAALDEAGIDYTVICHGPEPMCSDDAPLAA